MIDYTWIFWSIIFGAICWRMAKNRGRDDFWGAISGAVFGLFTIIYYWIVGDSKELREQKLTAEIERRGTK